MFRQLTSAPRIRVLIIRNALLLGLVAMIVVFAVQAPYFVTVGNFRNIALQSSIISIVAVPMALLLLSGYVDLSVGSNLALGAVVAAYLITHGGNPVLAAFAGVGAGIGVGILNGSLVSFLGFSAIIVTLGTLTAVRGFALIVAPEPIFGFGNGFGYLGRGQPAGIPVPVLIAASTYAVGWVFLNYMARGRHVHAIGVNREASYLSGISVRALPFYIFIATGAACGLGGVIYAARLDSAPGGVLGQGFELDVLTAVLLGGVAFGGGRGTIFGVLLGVLFLGILQDGLILNNIPNSWQLVTKGFALVGAAALDFASTKTIMLLGTGRNSTEEPPSAAPMDAATGRDRDD